MSDINHFDLATRAGWQKWEMDNLHSLPNRTVTDKNNARAHELKTKRQQAEILAEARKQGFKQGYDEGYKQGFTAGEKHGLQSGTEQGYINGLESGHQKGYQQGLQEGKKTGDEQARLAASKIKNLLDSISNSINNLEQDVGQSVIRLAIDIAGQVLHTQLKEQPELILTTINELINNNGDQNEILRIHLNPSDLSLVESHLDSINEYDFKLVASDEITAGGCIIDTEHGSIDASLESRWLRIIGALGYEQEYQ